MDQLLLEKRTIFDVNALGYYLNISNSNTLKKRIYRLTKSNKLTRLQRGLFYISLKNYISFELANKLLTPSYISFETVLLSSGFIFQPYTSIFSAGDISKTYFIENKKYIYRRLNPEILTNLNGIFKKDNYFIATPERAVLDMLYINDNFYFDNLRSLDFSKAKSMVSIYTGSKSTEDRMLKNLSDLEDQYAQ
ncbi:MAG: hypothetical protein ACYDBX_02305 [Patescibacteria group bacterium]